MTLDIDIVREMLTRRHVTFREYQPPGTSAEHPPWLQLGEVVFKFDLDGMLLVVHAEEG